MALENTTEPSPPLGEFFCLKTFLIHVGWVSPAEPIPVTHLSPAGIIILWDGDSLTFVLSQHILVFREQLHTQLIEAASITASCVPTGRSRLLALPVRALQRLHHTHQVTAALV